MIYSKSLLKKYKIIMNYEEKYDSNTEIWVIDTCSLDSNEVLSNLAAQRGCLHNVL